MDILASQQQIAYEWIDLYVYWPLYNLNCYYALFEGAYVWKCVCTHDGTFGTMTLNNTEVISKIRT